MGRLLSQTAAITIMQRQSSGPIFFLAGGHRLDCRVHLGQHGHRKRRGREAKGRLMTVAIQRSRRQRRPGANSSPVPFCRRPVSGPEWVRFREQIAEGCVWPDLFGAAGPLSCSSHRKSKPKSEMTDEEFAAALARIPVLTIEVVRLPGWEGATPTI